jgi:splicing factor 3B subunit 3
MVIALEGGEIIYFELDQLGQMVETEKINLDAEVVALDIGQVPEDM